MHPKPLFLCNADSYLHFKWILVYQTVIITQSCGCGLFGQILIEKYRAEGNRYSGRKKLNEEVGYEVEEGAVRPLCSSGRT